MRLTPAKESTSVTMMTERYPHPERHAQLVFLDPGETTGVCVVTVRPGWLQGRGELSWAGLGKALSNLWLGQIGSDVALVSPTGRRAVAPSGRVVKSKERIGRPTGDPELEMLRQLEALLDLWPRAAWGYEDFLNMRADSSRAYLSPVRVFSVLKYNEAVYGYGRQPLVQSPSLKTSATDERMKMAGLYQPGMRHATDAARHAALFLREARTDESLRRMAWPNIFDRERSTTKESA